jgi:peptidoglycan/LPS O-acetylase OafA/YrhL
MIGPMSGVHDRSTPTSATAAISAAPSAVASAGNVRPNPGGRAAAIDGLRGAAALAVIFYHAILACDPSLVDRAL